MGTLLHACSINACVRAHSFMHADSALQLNVAHTHWRIIIAIVLELQLGDVTQRQPTTALTVKGCNGDFKPAPAPLLSL